MFVWQLLAGIGMAALMLLFQRLLGSRGEYGLDRPALSSRSIRSSPRA